MEKFITTYLESKLSSGQKYRLRKAHSSLSSAGVKIFFLDILRGIFIVPFTIFSIPPFISSFAIRYKKITFAVFLFIWTLSCVFTAAGQKLSGIGPWFAEWFSDIGDFEHLKYILMSIGFAALSLFVFTIFHIILSKIPYILGGAAFEYFSDHRRNILVQRWEDRFNFNYIEEELMMPAVKKEFVKRYGTENVNKN